MHRYNEQFAAGCVQRMGAYATEVGTRNVARDLEAIRIALGEPKLDYLGYSYGTIVGITYAQMFPTTIRTMVLDGPPDYWLRARDYAYQQARGFMNALSAFLDWCDQAHCSLASAGSPRDLLQQLIARVDEAPLPATYTANGVTREGTLTPSLLESAVLSMLYDRSRGWPILADALAQAVPTRLGRGAAAARRPVPPAASRRHVAAAGGGQRGHQLRRPSGEEGAERGRRAGRRRHVPGPAPAVGRRLGDDRLRRACPSRPRATCSVTCTVRGAPPILVIGTTGDPATPYAGAQAMVARIAGSQLLTFDSTEHTAYGRAISTCIDDAVDTYLVERRVAARGRPLRARLTRRQLSKRPVPSNSNCRRPSRISP